MRTEYNGDNRRNSERRTREEPESKRIVWWLIGSMFTIILILAGGWARHIDTELDKLNVIVSLSFSDVSVLKQAQLENGRRIDRIEGKVDKLLDKS